MKISWKSTGIFAVGFLWGAGLVFTGGVLYLRSALICEYQSEKSFEEVERELPGKVMHLPGWTVQDVKCALPEASDGSRMHVYRLCQRDYAQRMIDSDDDRRVSAVIPCTFAVYEKANGKTYLARLNTALAGRLLGGRIAEVFTGKVTPEQEIMLETILKK